MHVVSQHCIASFKSLFLTLTLNTLHLLFPALVLCDMDHCTVFAPPVLLPFFMSLATRTVSKDYEAPKLGVVLCFVVVAHFWWPLLSILYLLAVVVGFRGVLLGYYLFLFWRSSFLLMHHLQWDYPRQHQHCNHCSRAVVLLFFISDYNGEENATSTSVICA